MTTNYCPICGKRTSLVDRSSFYDGVEYHERCAEHKIRELGTKALTAPPRSVSRFLAECDAADRAAKELTGKKAEKILKSILPE